MNSYKLFLAALLTILTLPAAVHARWNQVPRTGRLWAVTPSSAQSGRLDTIVGFTGSVLNH